MEKHHIVYKITNLINNKIYIGVHETFDVDDGYMGSGTYLNHAQKKHGLENFKKEILHVFSSREEAYAKEAEIVTVDFLAEENTYNLNLGGKGGWHACNSSGKRNGFERRIEDQTKYTHIAREAFNEKMKNPEFRKKFGEKISKSTKGKQNFLGKTHTEETKAKIGNANSIKQSGSANSQFGSMWINNGTIAKKIKNDEIIPEGWNKGRKILLL